MQGEVIEESQKRIEWCYVNGRLSDTNFSVIQRAAFLVKVSQLVTKELEEKSEGLEQMAKWLVGQLLSEEYLENLSSVSKASSVVASGTTISNSVSLDMQPPNVGSVQDFKINSGASVNKPFKEIISANF